MSGVVTILFYQFVKWQNPVSVDTLTPNAFALHCGEAIARYKRKPPQFYRRSDKL